MRFLHSPTHVIKTALPSCEARLSLARPLEVFGALHELPPLPGPLPRSERGRGWPEDGRGGTFMVLIHARRQNGALHQPANRQLAEPEVGAPRRRLLALVGLATVLLLASPVGLSAAEPSPPATNAPAAATPANLL